MEYFLTTYNKDYKWPVPFSVAKEEKRLANVEKVMLAKTKGGGGDACCSSPPISIISEEIPPAQCGLAPVGPESRFGQPNTYLRKLYNKYPHLYNILSITPPEELAKIAYADKFQTTYRADYTGEGFDPMKFYSAKEMPEAESELMMAVNKDKSYMTQTSIDNYPKITPTESQVYQDMKVGGCVCPASQTVCSCGGRRGAIAIEMSDEGFAAGDDDSKGGILGSSITQAPVIPKPTSITKIPRTPCPPKEEEKAPEYKGGRNRPRLGKWKTEYKDTISRVGGIIIDKKLLTRFPKEDTRLK